MRVLWPFRIDAEPVPHPAGPGLVTLQVTVTPAIACDQITLIVTKIDNLTYDGPDSLTAPAAQSEPTVLELYVVIPANDTSGLEFEVTGGGTGDMDKSYWVVHEDTVKFYRGNPRLYPSVRYPRKPPRIIRTADSLEAEATKYPQGRQTIGYFDEYGNLISKEEYQRQKRESEKVQPLFVPGDTTVVWHRDDSGQLYPVPKSELPSREERERERALARIRELEKTPLEGVGGQRIGVGDEVWVRSKGEYKFHKVEPVTDVFEQIRKEQAARQDSAQYVKYHIVMDLRKEEDYRFVEALTDSLIPMERTGFYHSVVSKPNIGKIENRGIQCSRHPDYPGERKKKRQQQKLRELEKTGQSEEPEKSSSSDELDTLFFEGFEGAWPRSWIRQVVFRPESATGG